MTELPTPRCWVEISCDALRHNVTLAQKQAGAAVELLAIVKANAYGHGMLGVARALAESVQLFGVANLEEALALRRELAHPIIILGPALPEEITPIVENGFIPSVSTLEEAELFSHSARGKSGGAKLNVKIDTGMGRMGMLENIAVATLKGIAALSDVTVHSISTHLPVSNEDATFTREQLARFSRLVQQLREVIPYGFKVHALQSAGLFAFNEQTFDIVRAGIVLYGIPSLPDLKIDLKPAMTWKTRVALIRDVPAGHGISYGRTFITPKPMRVATLSAGYADGYPRHLSSRDASVLIRGSRCALLGRVTMDLMVVDVTDVPEVETGDEVVLMGRQGDNEVSCVELADRAGTITWEITTRIGSRVQRVYT